jgi:zinc transport system ATP-binding protein
MSAALVARGATVAVGGRRILEDVSFEVARGEFACLCGPNGGGKTTLLRAALGLVPLAGGEIAVLGAPPGAAGRAVGYLPQVKAFNPSFPARVVDMIAANRRGAWAFRLPAADREAARAALARVGGERLLDERLGGLSGGELQRAYLARALVNDPALLLLDEPTAGVDARGRGEFLDLLAGIAARDDLAALLVTHNAGAVRRLAARVVYLDGRVRAWGPPAEVLDREWDRAAFSGHDHALPDTGRCEEEE